MPPKLFTGLVAAMLVAIGVLAFGAFGPDDGSGPAVATATAPRLDLATANMAEEPSEQSASLWWPADRAWFVATDIDLVTTFVGGSAACIGDVLRHPRVEAARVPIDQRFTWDADTVNPLPYDAPD